MSLAIVPSILTSSLFAPLTQTIISDASAGAFGALYRRLFKPAGVEIKLPDGAKIAAKTADDAELRSLLEQTFAARPRGEGEHRIIPDDFLDELVPDGAPVAPAPKAPSSRDPFAVDAPERPSPARGRGGGKAPTRGAKPPAKDVVLHAGEIVVVSPVFKLVFLAVLALTLVSGASAVALAFGTDPHAVNQQAVFDSMNTGWKLGLGAILGLLGGKAA